VRQPATIAALTRLSEPASQARMVFIVGAARCGTTAMQGALNASDDVFMLGEAFFFWENLRPGFRARYNEKYRGFGLAPNKHFACPAVAPEDATWVETVTALASRHHLVGDKIPFGGYKIDRWPSEFLAFQRRHFYRGAYILMFRNPRDAILSPRSSWGIQDLVPWARSYIAAQRTLLRLRRNFPRTVPVFLETVGHDTHRQIEHCLDHSLPSLGLLLRKKNQSPGEPDGVPPELRKTVEGLEALYPTLGQAVCESNLSRSASSLDAIDGHLAELYRHLDPVYYSIDARLGRLRSKVETAARMARSALRQTTSL
jgi:sulfotransferase family protein